jgi:hypothetical protein
MDGIVLAWHAELSDEEMIELVRSHGGNALPGWWNQILSLGCSTSADSALPPTG